jgi:hypothetical protein
MEIMPWTRPGTQDFEVSIVKGITGVGIEVERVDLNSLD